MPHLAVYGHVNLDLIYHLHEAPKANATVEVTDRTLRYGGTAGNIAAIAGSLGVPVRLASFVGGDFPKEYREHLERLGVDCSELVVKQDYGTPTWWGFIDPDHNVVGIVDQGPMRDMSDFELLTRALDGADMVHLSTGRPAYYERIAAAATKKKLPITLDPGQELRPLYEASHLEQLLEAATYFIVNHHELEIALDKMSYGEAGQLFDHDLDAVIETRGARGVRLHRENETVDIPAVALPKGQVRDTTGAGDSFRAGFHAARRAGNDLVAACRWGNASAAITVQHVGAQEHLPKRAEVEALAAALEDAA